jgi:hypothetical protein
MEDKHARDVRRENALARDLSMEEQGWRIVYEAIYAHDWFVTMLKEFPEECRVRAAVSVDAAGKRTENGQVVPGIEPSSYFLRGDTLKRYPADAKSLYAKWRHEFFGHA